MAEYIMKDLLRKKGIADVIVDSAGVSSEEEGNDIYPPAKRVLREHGIPFSLHHAHRITDEDYASNDRIIALDSSNLHSLQRRFGREKISMLLDRDVADPWYTDDFETAFSDILKGFTELADSLT